MALLEFILILETLIVGLGVAEVLGGTSRIFRSELRFGRLHFVWLLTVFVLQVQYIWSSWTLLADVGEWPFLKYLLELSAPVCLYLVSATLFPSSSGVTELDQYTNKHGKKIFLLIAALMAIYSLQREVLFGGSDVIGHINRGSVIIACVALTLTDRVTLRWALSIGVFADVVGYAILRTPAVSAS